MNLERVVYLTEANYNTLVANNTVTANGQTVNYSANDLYITPIGITGIQNGGTGVNSLTANSVLMSGATTTSPITTRGLTDQTTAGTNPTANNNIITANTLMNYSGTANIKTVGTITSGTWQGTAIASTYIGSHNHAASNITSGQLGVAYGGTGAASFTANSAIISGSTTTAALTTRGITNQTTAGNPTANTNLITANTLMNYIGTSNIKTVGTITSGTWSGDPVDSGFITSTAISIPAAGSSVTKTLQGLTADYQLVRWNFSSSPENAPPASLTWTTSANSFTITNNFGSTSQTIQPVFIKPASKAIS